MAVSNSIDCRRPLLGLTAGLWREVPGKTITFGALSLGLLVLASCSTGSKYFQDGVNEVTQEMVGKRHGRPHQIQPVADGGETWTYFERGSGTAGFSGQARGSTCKAYVLTFDKQMVLRDWRQQPCQG